APDDHIGRQVVVHGQITQLDAATGKCFVRVSISYTPQDDWYEYEHNSVGFAGDGESDCPVLDPFVADDEVTLWVTIGGSLSYDTQIGGSTTVPAYLIDDAELIGEGRGHRSMRSAARPTGRHRWIPAQRAGRTTLLRGRVGNRSRGMDRSCAGRRPISRDSILTACWRSSTVLHSPGQRWVISCRPAPWAIRECGCSCQLQPRNRSGRKASGSSHSAGSWQVP